MSLAHKPTVRKLGRNSNGMLMTPEEFDAVTRWDPAYRYELIRGVVIVSPIPSEAEADPNEDLGFLLRFYREYHPSGSSLDKTLVERYVAVQDGRRRADRVIWAGLGRVPNPKEDHPTIVVEFVSKRSRDRVRDYEEKRREYLDLGIREYWIIDRFRRTMTVFSPDEVIIEAGAIYQTPILPGFELPLSRLLKIADDWTKPTP